MQSSLTKAKRFTYYFLCAAFSSSTFFSCQKEAELVKPDQAVKVAGKQANVQGVSVVNGRIRFENQETYNRFVKQLNYAKHHERNNWKKQFSYVSLDEALNAEIVAQSENPVLADLEKFGFPPAQRIILNEKGEFQVGNTIVWYHAGYLYSLENGTEQTLGQLKANPSADYVRYEAGSQLIRKGSTDAAGRISLGENSWDARHQHEFYAGGTRKYVHELYSYYQNGPIFQQKTIYVRIKMEYKNSKGRWNPAGELRDISYGLNYSWTCRGGATFNPSIPIGSGSGRLDDYLYGVNDLWISLGDADYGFYDYWDWSVEVSGWIKQSYAGGSYPWTNSGYPLW